MRATTRVRAPASPTLRQYPRDAAEAFRAGARRGPRRMLEQMATGLGKPVLFAHLAHEAVALGGRVLILAHRDELLTSARDKLLMADSAADVGIVRAELDGCDAVRESPPKGKAAVATTAPIVVVICASCDELLTDMSSVEAVVEHVPNVATASRRPVGVNLRSGPATFSTNFIGPEDWSDEEVLSWVTGQCKALERQFGDAAVQREVGR